MGMFTSELQENSSESLRGGKSTEVLYLLGNIHTGKSKRLFLSIGKSPSRWGNLNHGPLPI
jgi:hypothetical protein